VAFPSGSSATDSDVAPDPSDPGARLLVRIGDFIEPLTRFDRSHLAMAESRHELISVLARQVFRVVFEVNRAEGAGSLPPGVQPVADASALTRETEAQLASARAQAPARLAAWAEEHGEEPLARPKPEDCFAWLAPLGHTADCATCEGDGKIACLQCKGAKELPCEACDGRGARDCGACSSRGQFECRACQGAGKTMVRKERLVWDDAIGQHRTEYYQEAAPCEACAGAGGVKCDKCGGAGQLPCKTCNGSKAVACKHCSGEGTQTCEACGGAGKRHFIASLSCSIRETFEVAARTSDSEIARVLKTQASLEDILKLAGAHRSSAEASNDTLTRDTLAETPVTSVAITAGGSRAIVRGFGPGQDVLDYRNLAGMLLAGDLAELVSALSTTRLFPPKVNDELYAALASVLASEANARIVRSGSRLSPDEMQKELRGVVSAEHVTRAGEAIRKGVNRAYWAHMAHGWAAVLLIPLSFAVLDLLMRWAGEGPRLVVLLGVMAATFGAAAGAHFWIVRQLQRRIARHGVPKLGPIVDRTGPTSVWLITAGAVAVVLTLLVASFTSSLFPPG
jgi:hypothetical protein